MPVTYRSNIPYIIAASAQKADDGRRYDSLGRVYTPRSTGWTDHEVHTLRRMMREKFTSVDISNALGRSKKAITAKAHLLGLTFTAMRAK